MRYRAVSTSWAEPQESFMSTHLSQHFFEKRIAIGLKPSQLARLAGCSNVLKNGNRIRQWELGGKISLELLMKIASVLEIEQHIIEKLAEQDRQEFIEAWLKWVDEPIQPRLVVRLMAAIYSSRPVPENTNTMEEAEKWASSIAKQQKMRCCLVWSRRISCWFDENGVLEGRTKAEPGKSIVPWMQIGNKKFTFDQNGRK
jgi:transcriptional regulator with XRE-family HTH domain